jgi:RimJ/RimL family protein N-acetyltransferase
MSAPTLTDGVVTLRAHRDADIPAVVEQSTDPLSVRWTRVPVPYGIDDAKRFVRVVMPGGWESDREWGFAVEVEGRFAGTVTLRNEGERRAEIAYGAHPWARGRGHVERALRLLLAWGFAERDLETVVWWAEAGNWASRRTAWRLGFSCDGMVRHWLPERDGLVDGWIGVLGAGEEQAPRNAWHRPPVLHGDGVVLRPHRETDVPRIAEACSDERTSYWLGGIPRPYTEDDARAYLLDRGDRMARGNAVYWAVADPDVDLLLGSIAVMELDGLSGPEVGYWAHPSARGHGVMSEALRLVVRHCFIDPGDGGLGLERVRLVAAYDNPASRRVAEVNGFRTVGTERKATLCRDGRHDAVVHDLVAEDLR